MMMMLHYHQQFGNPLLFSSSLWNALCYTVRKQKTSLIADTEKGSVVGARSIPLRTLLY